MPDLRLLVHAPFAAAIIGKGGHKVRSIKIESGVEHIHLSQNDRAAVDRSVTLTGDKKALRAAYAIIAPLLRAEAKLSDDAPESVRLIVPDADSLVGNRRIREVQTATGATVELAQHGTTTKEKLVTCRGQASQTTAAVYRLSDAIAERHNTRHREFLSHWAFETNYNDHFETPKAAYAHLLPLLQTAAALATAPNSSSSSSSSKKRKRALEPSSSSSSSASSASSSSLDDLVVYDPYYCKGAVIDAFASLGLPKDHVLNVNRDFYQDISEGAVPHHDVLVTNPPYSADHKQKLLTFLCDDRSQATTPFCLLMPAWVAATDYWKDFLRRLAATTKKKKKKTKRQKKEAEEEAKEEEDEARLERTAGVFYLSPTERYSFTHPQSTGHATSPFHSIWFCGGWPTKGARRAALASLRSLRTSKAVEIFRDAAMLQKRAHFVPASAAKQTAVGSTRA